MDLPTYLKLMVLNIQHLARKSKKSFFSYISQYNKIAIYFKTVSHSEQFNISINVFCQAQYSFQLAKLWWGDFLEWGILLQVSIHPMMFDKIRLIATSNYIYFKKIIVCNHQNCRRYCFYLEVPRQFNDLWHTDIL